MAHRFIQDLQKGENIKQNGQLTATYDQNIRKILNFAS